LVAKLANLNQPIEGVPEAIDLDAVHEESETDSDETPTEEPILSQELAEKDGLSSEEELDDDDWAVGW